MIPLFWAFCVFGVIDLIFVGCTMIHVLKLVQGIVDGKIILQAKITPEQTNLNATNFEFIDTIKRV
jgi:hypothetical protein